MHFWFYITTRTKIYGFCQTYYKIIFKSGPTNTTYYIFVSIFGAVELLLYLVHSVIPVLTIKFELYSPLYTVAVQCTVYSVQCTLYTVHSAQCTVQEPCARESCGHFLSLPPSLLPSSLLCLGNSPIDTTTL